MNIYRHKETRRLYTITHLILDVNHLNRNAFAGICASPYNWYGEQIEFINQDQEECALFVEQMFEIVAHT